MDTIEMNDSSTLIFDDTAWNNLNLILLITLNLYENLVYNGFRAHRCAIRIRDKSSSNTFFGMIQMLFNVIKMSNGCAALNINSYFSHSCSQFSLRFIQKVHIRLTTKIYSFASISFAFLKHFYNVALVYNENCIIGI